MKVKIDFKVIIIIITCLIIVSKYANAQWLFSGNSIYNDPSYKKVGINSTAPDAVLQINSYNTKGVLYPANIKFVTGDGNEPFIYKIQGEIDGSLNFYLFNNKVLCLNETKSIFSNNLQVNGNLGIGTTTPQSKLQVEGNITVPYGFALNRYTSDWGVNATRPIMVNSWSSELQTDFLYLGCTGNISNLNQSAMFFSGAGIRFGKGTDEGNNLGTEWMRINSSGNVGIGNNNPTEKLEVNGNVNLSDNSVIMINGKLVMSNKGSGNVFSGNNAGKENSGMHNTFIGNSSGWKNTTGSKNTFIGSSTGTSVTTGGYNSFIGTASGQTITTGSSNTFIGCFTNANTGSEGISNATAIGFDAKVTNSNSMQFGNNNVIEFTFGDNAMKILNGSVIIGTGIKLYGDGNMWVKTEIVVNSNNPWFPDYVFTPDYKLQSLTELETYINEKKHLPGLPTAKEVEASGIKLGEMSFTLTQKIEELTLYIIEQNKKSDAQCKMIEELQKEVKELKKNNINKY